MRRGGAVPAVLALAGLLGACSGGEPPSPAPAAPAAKAPPAEPVARAFFPRRASEDFWETVPLAAVGSHFLLFVRPRIETPAEGPWTATFLDPAGEVLARHRGLRVDAATGRFTFLCRSDAFRPGEWTIRLEVEEGGLVAGERERLYRFRVE